MPARRRLLLIAAVLGGSIVVFLLAAPALRDPSNDRQWIASQAVPARVTRDGPRIEIRNVRDFTWRTDEDFDRHYIVGTYDLRELDSVWYAVSRFGSIPGLAHSFLTFGFGEEYVAISVEARREAGEAYSPLRGILGEYELMYVIGTERDVVGLRTHVWKEAVSLYPIRTTPEKRQQVFVDMVMRAERLAVAPELYHTISSSCSSNIVRHVNAINPGMIRSSFRTVLPGYSDRIAWRLGMIDSDLPWEQVQDAFRIDPAGGTTLLDDDFSTAIRRHLPH
ncbi:MAG TPA: DUF4105 domain-containing protein [Thermoanaerobaculia bacterium]|nr:DUF4105 domain-containing protein [Thermoanaerobaculia bacterium]